MKNTIFIEIQRIVQLQFIKKQESKYYKPYRIGGNSKIKEIKIIFAGDNKQKTIPIYKKAIVDRYPPNFNNRNNGPPPILLTECDEESNPSHRKQLMTELDQNIKDYLDSDTYICQTEPSTHLKHDSWPLTPERKMKEIKIPLIKINLNPIPKKIYKHKVISRNNANYLTILMKDSSMRSQPNDSSNRISQNFELELLEQKQKMTMVNSIQDNEVDVLQRNTQIPRKSNKKHLDKSILNTQLIAVRDYSTKDFSIEDKKNDNKDDACNNGCDWNNTNCVII